MHKIGGARIVFFVFLLNTNALSAMKTDVEPQGNDAYRHYVLGWRALQKNWLVPLCLHDGVALWQQQQNRRETKSTDDQLMGKKDTEDNS